MLTKAKDFFSSKVFLINLLLALVFVGAVLGITYSYLDHYTHHGESISVPDLRGLKKDRLDSFVKDKHLHYAIVDSIFELDKPPGTIVDQDPAPDSKVKEDRTIYLTVNASLPPKIKMPDLIDVSYRQAEAILQTFGLKVGTLFYKPDLAKNAVLPTVIIKEEDRIPLSKWQEQNKIPIHVWHVFFDRAYGLSFDEAQRLVTDGLILPTEQVFQAPGGATTKKAIYKYYYHYLLYSFLNII